MILLSDMITMSTFVNPYLGSEHDCVEESIVPEEVFLIFLPMWNRKFEGLKSPQILQTPTKKIERFYNLKSV